jgi:hypothetical protein
MSIGGKAGRTSRRQPRTLRLPLLLAVATTALTWGTPAEALAVDAGVCDLDITLTSTTAVPKVPADRTWVLGGGGTCDTLKDDNIDTDVSGSLSDLADKDTVGCATALLDGTVTLELTHPEYDDPIDLTSVAVVAGAAVALEGVQVATVVATGAFEQTGALLPCVNGSITSATWSGTLAFVDPVL